MNLYYRSPIVTVAVLKSLKQRTAYLIRRSENGDGVTQAFVKKFREDVLTYFGKKALQYLELRLDAREHSWRVSSDFNYNRMERFGMVRGYIRKGSNG
jgi:hypothetical protein